MPVVEVGRPSICCTTVNVADRVLLPPELDDAVGAMRKVEPDGVAVSARTDADGIYSSLTESAQDGDCDP